MSGRRLGTYLWIAFSALQFALGFIDIAGGNFRNAGLPHLAAASVAALLVMERRDRDSLARKVRAREEYDALRRMNAQAMREIRATWGGAK